MPRFLAAIPTLALVLALVGLLALLPACGSVGPTAKQSAAGQTTANSPLDTTTMTVTPDGTNTFVATARGPVRESLLDAKGLESRSTGMVTRDVTWTNGKEHFGLASGSDFAAKGVKVNPATGLIEIAEFSTSSSEPLRALNEALDRYKDVWAKLSEEQRKQVEAQMDAIKVVSPPLIDALRAVLAGGV